MRNKIILYVIFLIAFSNHLCAQDKFERESRIKQSMVPNKALQFFDSIYVEKRIKWYKEEGLDKISFETKFKINKTKYSVEFDSLGNVEDIEVEVDWKDLKTLLKDTIAKKINSNCQQYKVTKVQIQYTGSKTDLWLQLKSKDNLPNITVNYELIVKCRQVKNVNQFEYLFNEFGHIVSVSKIIFKNSSHLEY